ncbi:hypothetical protein N9S55_01910, partial [Candidatus Pelagibacter bacterium]
NKTKIKFINIKKEVININKTKIIHKIIQKIINFFSRKNNKYLIFSSYLGMSREFLLNLLLKQLPFFPSKDYSNFITKVRYNKNLRLNLLKKLKFQVSNKFEKFLIKNLSLEIPYIFLENFKDLENFNNKMNLPSKPKKIFTANGLWYDSFMSFYTAIKKFESNSKIILSQHGGNYGLSKTHYALDYETNISDTYLSWSKIVKKKFNNTRQIGIVLKNKKNDINGDRITILMHFRKIYFNALESSTGTENYLTYLNAINKFLSSLSKKNQQKVFIRVLDIEKFGVKNEIPYLLKNYNFTNPGETFSESIKKSKIVINTVLSTPFIECMANDIPNILFINKKSNPIMTESVKYMNLLRKKLYLINDPKILAQHINYLFSADKNFNDWWYNYTNKKIRYDFRNMFCYKDRSLIQNLAQILKL